MSGQRLLRYVPIVTGLVIVTVTATTDGLAQSAAPHAPLSFETNAGQSSSDVEYLMRGGAFTISLKAAEAVLHVHGQKASTVRMTYVGANPSARVLGQGEQARRTNYYEGRDTDQWITDVRHYARVRYEDVYPGIDLVYYINEGELEFDWIAAPGADPSVIDMFFDGADSVTLDDGGNLIVSTAASETTLRSPQTYQEVGGKRRQIASQYRLEDEHVRLEVASYDATRPLVIDPVLAVSTYLGGAPGGGGRADGREDGDEAAWAVAVDGNGNIYVGGRSASPTFPIKNSLFPFVPGFSLIVSKFDPTGSTLLYSTYLPGGPGHQEVLDMFVESDGNLYLTGFTRSTDFPTTGNAVQPTKSGGPDAFVMQLDPTGCIVFSTFLGGGRFDLGLGIATDSRGHVHVAGGTASNDFPLANPLQTSFGGGGGLIPGLGFDAFVAELDAAGERLVYSTYLGGSGDDTAFDIASDAEGSVYVMGSTASTEDFPTVEAFQPAHGGGTNLHGQASDAFVAKIGPNGERLVYSTYLGGSGGETLIVTHLAAGIAVDDRGNAVVTSSTSSPDFPTTAGVVQPTFGGAEDAFVTQLDARGQLKRSTYLGGSEIDRGFAIALDSSGHIYAVGVTTSGDFPIRDAVQTALAGEEDVFVTKLDADASQLTYSTYFGGKAIDVAKAVTVDDEGNVYLAGSTNSEGLPTTAGAFQSALAGAVDAFVVKLADDDKGDR